ncbi:NADPH-dependent FMN reductase [Oceanobacillus sojae]|uniref:NADPH-dependent FMN reductase n=1 Tax=Oceanobacillus sojae TaxID=582851 RepID=UPI0009885490|nr:NADPH-dependent FMN reductase [Oceanobacillus sojae]MCT1902711.1 NAD(P)H-dependent oxidoreductase [Oceanobacillus sojae]
MKNFISILGTNSDHSTNRLLLQFIQKHFKDQANIEIFEIKDLPAFNKPEDRKAPHGVQELADKIREADGVIISSPEYNHSVPAALKSTLEWLSYTNQALIDKPVMLTGASYGKLGSSRAQSHLRQMLDAPELKARIMPSSEFLIGYSLQAFDDNGNLTDQRKIEALKRIFNDFVHFVDITNQLVNAKESQQKQAPSYSWEAK